MNTIWLWCGPVVMAGGVTLAAQASVPPTAGAQPTPAVAGAPATITATGCLKPWVDDVAAPAATPSGAVSPSQAAQAPGGARFTLTQIDATEGLPASETAGDKAELRMLLIPAASVNLAAHVNHRVTVSGTVPPEGSLAVPGATPSQPARPGSGEANLPPKPTESAHPYMPLAVSAVKMVAASCAS